MRLDPGEFPSRLALTAELDRRWCGTLSPTGLDLATVSAIYYRRPSDFTLPAGMSGPEQRFARAQARIGPGGILASLPARWINHPSALADAEYKPRQLAVATELGLSVPPTLITNQAPAVREFAARHGQLVVKPLTDPIVAEADDYTTVWTRLVTQDDLTDLQGVETTAHLFQAWVPKAYEVRITAVGAHVFPVAIIAGTPQAKVDWRSDYDALTYKRIDCPPGLTTRLAQFLDRFGLVYGAFDFAVTDDEHWVFLECNAAGQWGWLAEECDLPIAAAIAAELTGEAQ